MIICEPNPRTFCLREHCYTRFWISIVTIKQNLYAFWENMPKFMLTVFSRSFLFFEYFFLRRKLTQTTRGHCEDNVCASRASEARCAFRAGATFSSRPSARQDVRTAEGQKKTSDLTARGVIARSGTLAPERSLTQWIMNGEVAERASLNTNYPTRLIGSHKHARTDSTYSGRYRLADRLSGLCTK